MMEGGGGKGRRKGGVGRGEEDRGVREGRGEVEMMRSRIRE